MYILQTVFEQLRHADVLDLVCIQCPPDSADYIRVCIHFIETLLDTGSAKYIYVITFLLFRYTNALMLTCYGGRIMRRFTLPDTMVHIYGF